MANDVRVEVELDTDRAEKDAEGLKGKLSKAFGDMGKIAGGIFMAEVGGQLAGMAVDTIKSSIGLARDFNEIQSKSNTVFGESAKAINDWAASASTGFGQSKAQALDSASAFGNMFSQLGMGKQTAAEMSMKMTELASDFASFHNADITDVLQAQQAAFRGEYDALQKFVPTINAAAVQQEAMAETGKTNAAQLTAQEKAAATYTLMLKGAGDAQGDFDRTSGSLANQQRILSAQWQDLQVKIGQVLIPALTEIVTAINTNVIPAVRDFATKTQDYYEQNIKPAIENLKNIFNTLEPVIQPILETIGNHIKNVATIFNDTVGLILAIVSGDWGRAWDTAKQLVKDFVKLFTDDITGLKDILTGAIGLAASAAKDLGKGIFDAIWEGLGDLWQLGSDAITWILRGLQDNAGKIGSWAKDALDPRNWDIPGLSPFLPAYQHAGQIAGGNLIEGMKLQMAAKMGEATGIAEDIAQKVRDITKNAAKDAASAPDATGPAWNTLPSSPGGMGNPSVNYQDPRGVTLTADDIYAMTQDPNFGFVGARPVVINIDTVNAQTEADARTAAGTIAYSLATAGMVA